MKVEEINTAKGKKNKEQLWETLKTMIKSDIKKWKEGEGSQPTLKIEEAKEGEQIDITLAEIPEEEVDDFLWYKAGIVPEKRANPIHFIKADEFPEWESEQEMGVSLDEFNQNLVKEGNANLGGINKGSEQKIKEVSNGPYVLNPLKITPEKMSGHQKDNRDPIGIRPNDLGVLSAVTAPIHKETKDIITLRKDGVFVP